MQDTGQEGQRVQFGTIVAGFFRRQNNRGDKIYFGYKRGGNHQPTLHFPVLADGSVSTKFDGNEIYPDEEVVMIPGKTLGIKELVWVQ